MTIMLRRSTLTQRTWVFLIALFILGGISWADTFDLSDDIPLSPNAVEQVLLIEETGEKVFLVLMLCALGIWCWTFCAPKVQTECSPVRLLFPPPSERPLYQRISSYRI